MDDDIDLYRHAKAAQKRAEEAGFSNTAAALGRIADMVAQEINMDWGVVLPFAPRTAAPSTRPLPVGRQARR